MSEQENKQKEIPFSERAARAFLGFLFNAALLTIIVLNVSSAENAYTKCKEGEELEMKEDLSRLEFIIVKITGYYGAQVGCWMAKQPVFEEIENEVN